MLPLTYEVDGVTKNLVHHMIDCSLAPSCFERDKLVYLSENITANVLYTEFTDGHLLNIAVDQETVIPQQLIWKD